MAGGTLACVLGIVYFQNQGDAAPAPNVSPAATVAGGYFAPAQPVPAQNADAAALARPPQARPAPPRVDPPVRLSAMDVPDRFGGDSTPVCNVTAKAVVRPMAVVRLTIDAPCHDGQAVTLHHSGLMVTEKTDHDGQLRLDFPALTENAVFIVDFPDGAGTVALANVPSIHEVERFALQWAGIGAFQIHPRGAGAGRIDGGQASSAARPPTVAGTAGRREFVIHLGDAHANDARLAEIYTRPLSASQPLDVTVEAEVTRQTCGRTVSAQSIDWRRGGQLRSRDLVLSMPGCSAIGDFLVLNNLVEDLMIASR